MKKTMKFAALLYVAAILTAFALSVCDISFVDVASVASLAGLAVIFRPAIVEQSPSPVIDWYVSTPSIDYDYDVSSPYLIIYINKNWFDLDGLFDIELLYSHNLTTNPNSLSINDIQPNEDEIWSDLAIVDSETVDSFLSIIQNYEYVNIIISKEDGSEMKGVLRRNNPKLEE